MAFLEILLYKIHFNNESLPANNTLHFDHINSCIHMAVTLNGTRDVLFCSNNNNNNNNNHTIKLKPNDIYMTSPTYIMHGIYVPKLNNNNASVALQLRTLPPTDIASELYKKYTKGVCVIICKLLEKYNKKNCFTNI